MGYMLPLRYINVSKSPKLVICATRIVSMISTDFYQARRLIHDEKKKKTLINASGINAAKTAIILDNGAVVSSPLTIPVLLNAIERSNSKASVRNSARLKVYDVYDEESSSDVDEIVEEIAANTDENEDYNDDFDDDDDDE